MSVTPLNDQAALHLAEHHDARRRAHNLRAYGHVIPLRVPDPNPDRLTPADVVDLTALHVASALLPTASVRSREQVRLRWRHALKPVMDITGHPQWALAYVPGIHHGDNDTYAVHLPTGRVFGGECAITGLRVGEDTHRWLTRLTDALDTLLDGYEPVLPSHPAGA